jgi:TatA/E family protein of Tat protein translocase
LESIGTSELILIGLIALIIFGPRKLPEIAKKIGKTMNEFKRAGQEFRSTWEREVTLEEEEKIFFKDPFNENQVVAEIKYTQTTTITENKILAPEVKEVSQADFQNFQVNEPVKTEVAPEVAADSSTNKQDWL